MLGARQFATLIALGILALLLAVSNAVVFSLNRDAQAEINARQQYLQQTGSLEGLYRDIVKALAELAVKNNDPQLLQMLAAQGINVSFTPAAPPSAPASAAPPVPASKR